jgi:opacity protein-like surface antigen
MKASLLLRCILAVAVVFGYTTSYAGGGILDGIVGGYLPKGVKGASPNLGVGFATDWRLGYGFADLGAYLGLGAGYVSGTPDCGAVGCSAIGAARPLRTAAKVANPIVVAWPTSFDVGTLMGGLKLKHDLDGVVPFAFAQAGVVIVHCPESTTPNGAETHGEFGYKVGAGVTFRAVAGFGIEVSYLFAEAALATNTIRAPTG